MVKTNVKRVLAIAIAVILLVGTCFTGMVSATAAGLADGLDEVATKSLDACTRNSKPPEITDIAGGGVKIKYKADNGINADHPYAHNKNAGSIFGNTITLQFNDYESTSNSATTAGYREFQVILGSSNGDYNIRLTGGVPAIRFDTQNGKLLFVKGTSNGCGTADIISVIASDDALKYDNFKNKPFTLKVSAKSNWTKINVEVVIDGSTTVSGIISKTAWETEANIVANSDGSAGKLPTNATYFSVGGTTSNANSYQPFSIEYYGFKVEANPGNEDGSFVDFTEGLDEVASTLLNACGDNRKHPQTSVTDIQGGGIKLTYGETDQANAAYSYAHKTDAGSLFGNKITLQFNNYKNLSTYTTLDGYKQFQVILGAKNDHDYYIRLTGGVPAIRFDTVNGKLLFVKGVSNSCGDGQVIQEIATNDALKYDNFTGKSFTLTVSALEDWTQIDVKVTVGNTEITGAISKTSWQTEANIISGQSGSAGKLPTTSTYFAVSGTTSNARSPQPFSIEYYGFKKESLSSGGQGGSGDGDGGNTPSQPLDISDLTDIATTEKNLETRTDLSFTATDIQDGGVKMEWQRMSGYAPYRYSVNMGAFPGNGIKMQFANYQIPQTSASTLNGYGQIVVVLSSTTANTGSKIRKGVPFLQIDTVNGKLDLRMSNDDSFGTRDGFTDLQNNIIPATDVLKYANLKGKPFAISITMADNNEDYKIEVDVAGTVISGTMLVSEFNKASFHPTATSTYMSVGGIDNDGNSWYGWSIEYYGYKAYPQTASSLLDGLTEIATTGKNLETKTDLGTYVDLFGGGVALDWQRFSGYGPYRFSPNIGGFPGNGLMLQFANYKINTPDTTVKGYGQILICLSKTTNNDGTKIKEGTPFVQIDTVNGKVDLRVCNDASFGTKDGFTDLQNIIPDNNALKYENFKNKAFQVKFETADNGVDYKFTIDVAGTALTGTIFKEELDSCTNRPADTATFISVGGIDNDSTNYNKWSIEFYGIKNHSILMEDTIIKGDVAAVNTAIAALADTAKLDHAADILTAKAMYDSLLDKAGVTDADKLTRLMNELNNLRQAAKYKPTSTYIAREPLYDNEFGAPGARTVYSSVTDKGFKAEWRGGYIDGGGRSLLTQSVLGAYKLDGLRLFVDDLAFDDVKASDFRLMFTSGDYIDLWDSTEEMANRMISIRLGLAEDRLEINGLGMTQSWFAGLTQKMHRDNFEGKSMIVEWFKVANGDYVCSITLGEEVLAFTIAKAKIDAMTDFDENRVRMVIGTENYNSVFSMEVTGVYAELDPAAKAMMAKIDALPETVTSAAQGAEIDKVWAEYSALSVAQSEQVINNEKLTAARAAVRKFEGVDEEGRDKDGFYIPKVTDRYGKNESNGVYAPILESKYGGWNIDFNNASYGVKNTFNQKFVMDELTVRFDNFQYASGGSFVIGFESSTADCKVYDYGDNCTRYGYYLQVGYGNTIWFAYPGKDFSGMIPLFEPNEKLSAYNLINKEFYMSWDEADDEFKTMTFTFTVDNTDFVYKFDPKFMEFMNDRFDSESIEIVVHACGGMKPPTQKSTLRAGNSIDITGVNYSKYSGSQKKLIQEIIDAIDALPETASYDIEDTIDDIRRMYFGLNFTALRLGVTNYSKLVKLQDALFDMHIADGTLYAKDDEEDEEYEDEYYDDEYYEDEYYDDEYVEEDEVDDTERHEEEKKPVKKPVKVKKKVNNNNNNNLWIIIVVGAVILLAVAAMIIIILKRKAKEEK